MHRDRPHHYLGDSNEPITIDSSNLTSGTLQISFGGATLPAALPQIANFPPNPGDEQDLVATLTGPPGSHCALSIADVDGAKDITILSVGAGTFHDTVILEFVTGSAAVNTFVTAALERKVRAKTLAQGGSNK